MSQNIFLIDPIFFMPINEEYSKQRNKPKKNDFPNKNKINNIEKSKVFYSTKNNLSKYSFDALISKSKQNRNKNKKTIIFSSIKNDRNIKSMTNSSKIYTSEIFKKNWKLKSKRLIAKLKKKLIKKWKQTNNEENYNYKFSNFIKNNFVNKIIINSKSNNIDRNDFEFNNYIINNKSNINHINNIFNERKINALIKYQKFDSNVKINRDQHQYGNFNLLNNSVYSFSTDRPKFNINLIHNGC